MNETPEIGDRQARLAAIERELAGLQAQRDLAMSAFKFDEANALQRWIAAREDERQALAATLPAASVTPAPPSGAVPTLARPRRPFRRRR